MTTLTLTDPRCQTCASDLQQTVIDGRTRGGQWAYMCPKCFNHGPGVAKLGTGNGQQYTRIADTNHFQKAAG